MNGTIIVAESGADISSEVANTYGIHIVPMHILIDGKNYDDGSSFPIERVFEYHDRTRKLPTTSATNPEEYHQLFEKLHSEYPDKQILHLCYSAVTTATWQNALLGSKDMDYVHHVDTKNVSAGQAAIILKVAQYLEKHPLAPISQLIVEVEKWITKVRFGFIAGDLDYLRAGGRVSNAVYLGASILNIKPSIELVSGKLVAKKKYRGRMKNVCQKLISDFIKQHHLDTETLFFVFNNELRQKIGHDLELVAAELGYSNVSWVKAGGVISTHSGPGAFGIVGFSR